MRQGRDNGLILNDQSKVVAVNLGADFVAEHEWGIGPLQRTFGFGDEKKLGIERRKITKSPGVVWLSDVEFACYVKRERKILKYSGLFYDNYHDTLAGAASSIKDRAYANSEGGLITLWSEGDFCALAHNAEQIAQLKEIYEAFFDNDVAIWLGGGGVFQNAGLCIAIASRLSKDVVDSWHKADVDYRQLRKDVSETKIEDKLSKAGRKYYALSPKRQDDGSIKFWLNPMEQDRNNHGWYTVQQLEQWCEGTGPIPKKE